MNLANSKQWISVLRRVAIVVAAVGAFYLYQRYEILPLDQAGCSPLMSLRPGSTLWIDRQPSNLGMGDVLFFTLPDGAVGFGRCTRTEGDKLWVETDVDDCPAPDSDELGWLQPEQIHGRLIMAFDQ